jgi:DNA-binding response OmpR family regulator
VNTRQSTWPKRSAILVGESAHLHALIRQFLKSFQWTVDIQTQSAEEALLEINQGRSYLVIIDDSEATPATEVIRHFASDPLGVLTPVLVLLGDGSLKERVNLSSALPVTVIEKPLTPSKFGPGFKALLKRWESHDFLALRAAGLQWLKGRKDLAHALCERLLPREQVRSVASQFVALHLRLSGDIALAEQCLLTSLQKSPQDLGLMIALGDLYLRSAMPKMSRRILEAAKQNYGNSMLIVPDLAQASFMLGEFQEAATWLEIMLEQQYKEETVVTDISRIYFSLGEELKVMTALSSRRKKIEKMLKKWQAAEDSAFGIAS